MSIVIFAGPTISAAEVQKRLPALVRPPASQGDVYLAWRAGARAIGIIDGYFDQVPSVWHKEILWAISNSIPVYGSASMGALRAAELAAYGMVGVGEIFEAYLGGNLEDDDEVAVMHGPEETGYRNYSEAMVNIRATVARARDQGVISASVAESITIDAKSLFYADRCYPAILARARERGVAPDEIARFCEWLPAGAVNLKREDAVALLRHMQADLAAGKVASVAIPFEPTDAWEVARAETEQRISSWPLQEKDAMEDPGNQLTRLVNEELQLFAPYALVRALHKQELLDSDQIETQTTRQALSWYFERRLHRTIPNNLDEYAREIGMRDGEALRLAIHREYRYRCCRELGPELGADSGLAAKVRDADTVLVNPTIDLPP